MNCLSAELPLVRFEPNANATANNRVDDLLTLVDMQQLPRLQRFVWNIVNDSRFSSPASYGLVLALVANQFFAAKRALEAIVCSAGSFLLLSATLQYEYEIEQKKMPHLKEIRKRMLDIVHVEQQPIEPNGLQHHYLMLRDFYLELIALSNKWIEEVRGSIEKNDRAECITEQVLRTYELAQLPDVIETMSTLLNDCEDQMDHYRDSIVPITEKAKHLPMEQSPYVPDLLWRGFQNYFVQMVRRAVYSQVHYLLLKE